MGLYLWHMTKNPVLNALSAGAYIVAIAAIMTWGTSIAPGPDTFLAPIVAISLFTLSAAVMGYLFCFQPLTLYFAGKKNDAVKLFLQTVMAFGVLTAIAMGLLFSGVVR